MEKEINQYLENKSYQRNSNRIIYRNSYYECDKITITGTLTLKIHRTINEVFEIYQIKEKTILATIPEMYFQEV